MPVPILRLVLAIEERRGEEEPLPVTRIEWGADELPSRAYFFTAIELAYGSIELPYFPSAAWVEITTAFRSFHFEAAEPKDEVTLRSSKKVAPSLPSA